MRLGINALLLPDSKLALAMDLWSREPGIVITRPALGNSEGPVGATVSSGTVLGARAQYCSWATLAKFFGPDNQENWCLNTLFQQDPTDLTAKYGRFKWFLYGPQRLLSWGYYTTTEPIRPQCISGFTDENGKKGLLIFPGLDNWLQPAGPAPGLNTGVTREFIWNALFVTQDAFQGNAYVRGVFDVGDQAVSGTWPLLKASIATVYRGQIVMGDCRGIEGGRDKIFNSNLFPSVGPLGFAGLAKGVTIGEDGSAVNGLAVIQVTGGAQVEPYLVVFKRASVWMIQGYLPTSIDLGNYSLSPVLRNEGLVTKETIAETPYGLIWCSGRNVWLMPPGQQPVRIGNDIAEYLRTAPQGFDWRWHAVFVDGFYCLSIPKRLSSGYGRAADSTWDELGGDEVEQWWCDLRSLDDGSENQGPKWWGPMNIGVAHMLTADNGKNACVLRSAVVGGSTYVLGTQDLWGDSGSILDGSGSVATRAMTQRMALRAFDFGDPMLVKIIEAIEMFYRTATPSTPTFQVLLDDLTKATSGFTTKTTTGQGLGSFVLDTSTLDNTALGSKWVANGFHPTTRALGKTAQPVLTLDAHTEVYSVGVRVRPFGRRPTREAT